MGKVLNFSLATKIREFTDVLSQNVITELASIADDYDEKVVKSVSGPAYGIVPKKKRYVSFKDKNGMIRFFKTKNQIYQRGPLTNAGSLPIPKQTGLLSRMTAKGFKRIDDLNYIISIDGQSTDKKGNKSVNYFRYVHDGTEKMRPRPFLKWIMRDNKPTYIKRLKGVFKASRRQVGIRLDGK